MNVALNDVLVSVVITVVFAVLIRYLRQGMEKGLELANRWLEEKKEEARLKDDDISLKLFCTMQEMVNSIVYNAVAAMEQTTAAELRERVKKGLADRSELEKLAVDVLNGVRAQLEPDVEAILSMYITDMDAYLKNQIEASLKAIKSMEPAALPVLQEWGPGISPDEVGRKTAELPEEEFRDQEICME